MTLAVCTGTSCAAGDAEPAVEGASCSQAAMPLGEPGKASSASDEVSSVSDEGSSERSITITHQYLMYVNREEHHHLSSVSEEGSSERSTIITHQYLMSIHQRGSSSSPRTVDDRFDGRCMCMCRLTRSCLHRRAHRHPPQWAVAHHEVRNRS